MKTLLLVFWILCAGCDANSAADKTARQSASQPVQPPESAARAGIAAARERPATVPATGAAKLMWRGLELSKAPVTTDAGKLPDIWEQRPPGSKSYEIRADVTVILPKDVFTDATVYWIRSRNRFYVQRDELGSSTLHFYGPFEGDPHQVLKLPTAKAANG